MSDQVADIINGTNSGKPRRAWLAALLSLYTCALGQVYDGRFRRGVVLWLCEISLLFLCLFALVSLPVGRLGLALLLMGIVSFRIFTAVDAYLLAKQNRDAPLKGYQRWWIYVIIYVGLSIASVLLAHVGRSFICEAFVVPARSMSPTIHHGDRIIVDKLWANSNTMQRGDVVVFRSEGPDSPFFVQRVAGLPGETIEIVNERVLINGSPIDDSNAVFDGSLPEYTWREIANYGPLLIPSDCFFVLGDNRRFSRDSRLLGPIPLSDYHATARMIYWSQERTFLDPLNSSNYTLGSMRWDRMGARLD